VRQFANVNYHTGLRKDGDKTIVVQIVRDVQHVDNAADAEFRFPLEQHYDLAFNTPEAWLDSWWPMCRIPTAADEGSDSSTIGVMLCSHIAQIDAGTDLPPDSAEPVDVQTGVRDSENAKEDKPRTTPAVMMPSGDGLFTIQPELAPAECPTEEGSDLESILSVAE
jgi:hypothetical protein